MNRYIKALFVAALLVSLVGAASATSEKPTKETCITFINSFKAPAGSEYPQAFYEAYIKEFPAGDCDLWTGYVSVYYPDNTSSKGYVSIYVNENGKIVSSFCGLNMSLVKSYKGCSNGSEKPPITADPEIHNNTFNDTQQTAENITQVINETKQTAENITKVVNETGQTTGKIKETVRKHVRETIETVQDEERFKQAIKDQVKEKSNNISVPRDRTGQVINARAACTQIIDNAKNGSSSDIGIPQGYNSTLIPPTSNNTSDKINATVENFEQSEDKSPSFLRKLLNWIWN